MVAGYGGGERTNHGKWTIQVRRPREGVKEGPSPHEAMVERLIIDSSQELEKVGSKDEEQQEGGHNMLGLSN